MSTPDGASLLPASSNDGAAAPQPLPGNLTDRQYRFWLEQQLSPGQPVQRSLQARRLPSALAAHIDAAWTLVAEAVDACRARLVVVANRVGLRFESAPRPVDHVALPGVRTLVTEVEGWVFPDWVCFDTDDLLVRQALLTPPEGDPVWLLTASHLVCDGRSMDLLIDHMLSAMRCLAHGTPVALAGLPRLEADMATTRATGHAAVSPAIAEVMARVNQYRLPLTLFGRQPRDGDLRKERRTRIFGRDTTERLLALAAGAPYFHRSPDVTLANLFVALMTVWLWRHGGQSRLVVGVPHHGRAAHEHDLVGYKSRMLPLCLDVDPDATFAELVAGVHAQARQVTKLSTLSVDNPRYAPNYPLSVNYMYVADGATRAAQSLTRQDNLQQLEIGQKHGDPEAVALMVSASSDDPGAMRLALGVRTVYLGDVDPDALIAGVVGALEGLIHNPTLRVGDLDFTDPASRAWLAARERPVREHVDVTWLSAWAARARDDARRPAIVHDDAVLTHGELLRDAEHWRAHLLALGLRPGDLVIVWSDSDNTLCAACLALLSLGLIYTPVHAGTEAARVQAMAAQLNAALVCCPPARMREMTGQAARIVALDMAVVRQSGRVAMEDPRPDWSAHVFHTSGSTGVAKPIEVSHAALAASLSGWIEGVGLQPGACLAHIYSITFDPWLTGLLGALWLHGTCIVAAGRRPPDPRALHALLTRYEVDTLCTPTAYFHALSGFQAPPTLRRWLVGGEALAADRAMRFVGVPNPGDPPRLLNAYGPTETTIWASVAVIETAHRDAIPVGGPLATCGFRVADERGRVLPRGVPGELWITGPQLARGYRGLAALTSQQFVWCDGRLWYRTGDVVRWRSDGLLDFLGRRDRQVQVRGYRVEPAEVERALRQLDAVRDAVVVPVRRETTTELAAYVVPLREARLPDVFELRAELLRSLAEYKVPRWIVPMENLPTSANGKVALDRLPPPVPEAAGNVVDRMPTLTHWDLRLIFEAVLGVERVGVDDDFFAVGGDSLALVELLAAIERRFHRALDATTVIAHPTIGGLVPFLETDRAACVDAVVRMKEGNGAPLFCIPGAGGIGVEFYALSRRLAPGQSLLVLRSSGTDGYAHPPASLEALLCEHVEHIRRFRGDAPVHLAGYSLGGVFAWEVMQRLLAQGIPVCELVLIDSNAPTALGRRLLRGGRRSLRRWLSDRRAAAARQVELRQLAEALEAARREARVLGAERLGRYNLLAQTRFYARVHGRPADVAVTYLRSGDTGDARQVEAWRTLAPRMRVVTVPGTHAGDLAIVREPNVARLAATVNDVLRHCACQCCGAAGTRFDGRWHGGEQQLETEASDESAG
ncbi:MAG: AMP-binding protein [Pseudomonadales bacterium]